MKKYKLLKNYPGLPVGVKMAVQIGTTSYKLTDREDGLTSSFEGAFTIENSPEFWEEIKEPKYKILTVEMSSRITSIQRPDGSKINVGDDIRFFSALTRVDAIKESDYKDNDELYIVTPLGEREASSLAWTVLGTPRLTSIDGKRLYNGEIAWGVYPNWIIQTGIVTDKISKESLIFSTENAAKEYILQNRPMFSLKEITNYDESGFRINISDTNKEKYRRFALKKLQS